MPNLKFEVKDESDSIPRAVVRMRTLEARLRQEVIDIVDEAATEVQRVAKRRAPRGNSGRRIGRLRDAIHREVNPSYEPGGGGTLGGGGVREARVWVDKEEAPQIEFLWFGTPKYAPRSKILPKEGGRLAIEKRGEGVHFRMWVRGQLPQRRWWWDAQDAGERLMERKIRSLDLPHDR